MRGRRLGTCMDPWRDRDWPGVVLMDTQIRFASLRGVRVNEWRAALWAAAANPEFRVLSQSKCSAAPASELAPTGHRMSPRTKALSDGFEEIVLQHPKYPSRTGIILTTAADRFRKKRAAWLKREVAAKWLYAQSVELACHLYPDIADAVRHTGPN